MADLRIVDAPVLLQESITDDVKMPTGGLGNFSIRLGDIVWYVVTKEQLASKNYVDLSSKGVKDSLDEHIADKANPHNVTKTQVGLGNVDNTADIDKPVSNAVRSAIITATTDMATKTYVNQKDNLKADVSYVDGKDGDLTTLTTTDKTSLVKAINEVVSIKANKADVALSISNLTNNKADNATTLLGYGIADAYTKSEIDTDYSGVKTLYGKNVQAGAGANGWIDTLVSTTTGETQQQRNKRTFSILDYFSKSEFDNYKANVSTFDATNIIKRALLSADILDCDNVPLRISSPLTVRKGCKFLNLNITNLNTMIASVLVNSKVTVTGRIVGSGIGGDNIERGIFGADGDGAITDVNLDIAVSNLTVGVQVSNSDMVNTMCSRWCGVLRFENLTGGGVNSNGYGVLMPRASQCDFTIFANNVPRHDVYLSAGSVDNDIVCHSNNNKGSPLSMASYANQEYNAQNRVTMYINNCTPQSSSSKFAAVITGKTKHNEIYLHGRNSPTLDGALVFRSLAADATCHGNYAYINWVGGSSSNLISNEASFNNEFDIVGSGGIVGSSGGALLSATDYNGITGYSDGVPRFTARIKSLNWDAAKTEAGHSTYTYALIQGLAWADMDIGEGVLKGAKGFAGRKVALYAGNIMGSTHRERIKTTKQTIAANTSVDITITHREEFSNISIPLITAVVLDSVFVNTVTATIVSQNAAGCIVRVSNSGATAQQVIIVGEVSGY